MTLARHYERSQRTADASHFSGGYLRGPIEPMEQPKLPLWRRLMGVR